MQISSDLKSLELLGISGKGRLQFCEDLEFLGIPRNSLEFYANKFRFEKLGITGKVWERTTPVL